MGSEAARFAGNVAKRLEDEKENGVIELREDEDDQVEEIQDDELPSDVDHNGVPWNATPSPPRSHYLDRCHPDRPNDDTVRRSL